MSEKKEEEKVGVIEDMKFEDGIWYYKVRYSDGSVEWVPEDRLRRAGHE